MRYREIVEATVDVAAERSKITAANAEASDAAQSYQRTLKAARDRAATARRKLNSPKPPAPPVAPQGPG